MNKLFVMLILGLAGLGTVSAAEITGLAGKDCRGTFDTGTGNASSRGSVQLQFFVKDGGLAATYRLKNSTEAFENPRAPIASPAEEVTIVPIRAQTLRFVTSVLGNWTLTFSSATGKLVGELDPRANQSRRNWLVAKVDMTCEESVASK
jgi:hypothetical protein